jgi:hypothetical protein
VAEFATEEGRSMEQILYIVGQCAGIAAVILGFINYQVKTREQVLYIHISTALCFVVHYLLIGAYVGMAMNMIGVIHNVVFYFVGKKGKVGKGWALGFAGAMAVMGIIAWESWYSVFALVGLVINSCAMSFSNPNNIRKSILITSPLVIVYNLFVRSWGGAAYETVAILSAILGIVRFGRNHSAEQKREV